VYRPVTESIEQYLFILEPAHIISAHAIAHPQQTPYDGNINKDQTENFDHYQWL